MTSEGDFVADTAFGGLLTLIEPVMEAALPREPAFTTKYDADPPPAGDLFVFVMFADVDDAVAAAATALVVVYVWLCVVYVLSPGPTRVRNLLGL